MRVVPKVTYKSCNLCLGEGLLSSLQLVKHHPGSSLVQPRLRHCHALAQFGADFFIIIQVPVIAIVLQGAEAVPTSCSVRDQTGFGSGY